MRDTRKMRTDTVMGEDLEKIFVKLNRSMSGEESKTLEEQRAMIEQTFLASSRKRKIKSFVMVSAVMFTTGVVYYFRTMM